MILPNHYCLGDVTGKGGLPQINDALAILRGVIGLE